MGRFTSIIEFDNCDNCPFREYVDDDYSPIHTECGKTGHYIEKWGSSNGTDYRNKERVLDDCPFLTNNVIKEEE
jgi:hypothetical protein